MTQRSPSILAIGLACAALGASAWAADPGSAAKDAGPAKSAEAAAPQAGTDPGKQSAHDADRTAVVPSKEDLTPFKPSVEVLDDNTQRAHDRDQAAAPRNDTAGAQAQAEAGAELAYDFKRMDKDGDNLITPEEMTAELNRGKATASAAGTAAAPGDRAPATEPAASPDQPAAASRGDGKAQ